MSKKDNSPIKCEDCGHDREDHRIRDITGDEPDYFGWCTHYDEKDETTVWCICQMFKGDRDE